MYSKNYNFSVTNAVKIIVQNSRRKVLLIQEPENNEWMPLHWGLPGGKPTKKESLEKTIIRKSQTDVGQNLDIRGLLEIEEMLIEGKTVMMYIVYAKTTLDKIKGEAKDYRWVDKKDIEMMNIEDFTEYFNKKLLLDFFEGKLEPIPLKTIKTWEYYKIKDEPEYKKWIESGKK